MAIIDPYAHGGLRAYPEYSANEIVPTTSSMTRELMIAMRMGWSERSYAQPVEALICAPIKDNQIAVFFVCKGTAIVLEDGSELFPSDALITQIRMIVGDAKPAPTDANVRAEMLEAKVALARRMLGYQQAVAAMTGVPKECLSGPPPAPPSLLGQLKKDWFR